MVNVKSSQDKGKMIAQINNHEENAREKTKGDSIKVSFTKKRKHNQHKFYFEGNILEEVADCKCLRIDFNKNLSWNGCRKKRTLEGWKTFYVF